MKPYTINGTKYWFEVFISANEPFILLSNAEYPSEGLAKIYFLRKFSMKFAMEDFVRYEQIVNDRSSAKQNEVR